jgi:hypothetical protein
MNALTKLFSFKPAKKTLKGPITLCALFAVAVLLGPGCSGCIESDQELGSNPQPKFLTLNVADGIPSVHSRVITGTPGVTDTISLDAATGTPTPIVEKGVYLFGKEWINATYNFSPSGSTTISDTYEARAYKLNLGVVMGTAAAPLMRNIGMAPVVVPNVIVMQADHTIGPIDIYVTAPGTNLATVGPDAADRAYANYTIMNAIHTGATFQVRATLAGTKTVVADFGTTAAARERTSYVFVMAEVSGAKMLRNLEFTQD